MCIFVPVYFRVYNYCVSFFFVFGSFETCDKGKQTKRMKQVGRYIKLSAH